jgi:chromosome segregation ATPase
MDDASTATLGSLRRRQRELEAEARRLEAQVAHLEKLLDGKAEDDALGRKLGEVQGRLDATQADLLDVEAQLETVEATRAERAEAIDELEQLVDSFKPVVAGAPELAPVLTAMQLCVGALASARKLERSHEALVEPKDIARSLTQALTLLATTLSTASGLERLKPR